MVRTRGFFRRIFFTLVLGVCSAVTLYAQVDREAATREVETQTELKPEERPAFEKRPPKAEIEEKKKALPPEMKGPSFRVSKIVIQGNTLLPPSELERYARDFEGRELYFSDLEKLARLITNQYRRAGYTTTQAYIPPQTVKDETVLIQIAEGKVGLISVEGNRYFKENIYLDQLRLESGEFFEMGQLEAGLLDINRQPDRAARVYIEPGKESGTTDITLKAEDHFPVHASYEFNRRGSNLTGYSRHITHLTDNNLLGFGDSIHGMLSLAQEGALISGFVTYDFPWYRTGTVFHIAGGVAESQLMKYLKSSDVKGESFSILPGITQNFIRKSDGKLDGFLGFEIKDSITRVGGDKLSYDRMRVVKVGPEISAMDIGGQTIINSYAHVGIPEILGGSSRDDQNASRLSSGGGFVYGTLNLLRLQRLPFESYAVLQAGCQVSADPLTVMEQYPAGGMYSVRGYPEYDFTGDNGFNFSAELRVPPYFIPKTMKVPYMRDKTWRDAISLVGFIDGARASNYKRQIGTSQKDKTLLGAGFGVMMYLKPDFNFTMYVGFPFGDDSIDKNNPQLHLSVRAGF